MPQGFNWSHDGHIEQESHLQCGHAVKISTRLWEDSNYLHFQFEIKGHQELSKRVSFEVITWRQCTNPDTALGEEKGDLHWQRVLFFCTTPVPRFYVLVIGTGLGIGILDRVLLDRIEVLSSETTEYECLDGGPCSGGKPTGSKKAIASA